MKLVIRADAGSEIGGGHVMRCLALAMAARHAGHDVTFICADTPGHLIDRIGLEGFRVHTLTAPEHPDRQGSVEAWRAVPSQEDARLTADLGADADWIVLDHYGLGLEWVRLIRKRLPHIRVLAFDDLDRERLGADILLDPAHDGTPRTQQRMAMLSGPEWALLRPEFAELRSRLPDRPAARKLLVLPGMLDAAGLAPAALAALAPIDDLSVEVIMGRASQSCAQVQALVANRPDWTVTLDATDMAARMAGADFAIGAGGGTAWERCCLALPSVAVAVADNQKPGIDLLVRAGAAIGLDRTALRDPQQITEAVTRMRATRAAMARAAADLCDGQGAARVVTAMSGTLRPVNEGDARRLFNWRNQPRIRNASLDPKPLVWDDHQAYVTRISRPQSDGVWMIYAEGGTDIGHVNARRRGPGTWHWSFYIGAPDALPGAGKRMLTAFLRHLLTTTDTRRITAQVVATNTRSAQLHEDLGFIRSPGDTPAVLEFSLAACDVAERLGLPQD